MTRDEFVDRARLRHGDKYDYSLVPDDVGYRDMINIVCNEKHPWGETHGVFAVMDGRHIDRGVGCPKCSGRYKRTKEDFVKEAAFIHGACTLMTILCGSTRTQRERFIAQNMILILR